MFERCSVALLPECRTRLTSGYPQYHSKTLFSCVLEFEVGSAFQDALGSRVPVELTLRPTPRVSQTRTAVWDGTGRQVLDDEAMLSLFFCVPQPNLSVALGFSDSDCGGTGPEDRQLCPVEPGRGPMSPGQKITCKVSKLQLCFHWFP